MLEDDHDRALRQAAFARARELSRRYDDLVPLEAIREGFRFGGELVSFGSFYKGIFRPRQLHGPAALVLVTAPPKQGKPAPYEDTFDEQRGRFTYRFRDAAGDTPHALLQAAADNRTLTAAFERGLPMLYFRGIAPGQYTPLAPVFITELDQDRRMAFLEMGLPVQDADTLVSDAITRGYATRQAAYRLHQHRFRQAVLLAYRTRCTVCQLRESVLLQAAHIVEDHDPAGDATVVNGLALCAIHHLAYDRNLLGIDPDGVVHIHRRLLNEVDGPMLANGLQHFHGHQIHQPARTRDRPDPERLERRFTAFSAA